MVADAPSVAFGQEAWASWGLRRAARLPGARSLVVLSACGGGGAPAWTSSLAVRDIDTLMPPGSAFSERVKLRLPVPAALAAADADLRIAKAEPGRDTWTRLGGVIRSGDMLTASVDGFSCFRVVALARPPLTTPLNVQTRITSCDSGTWVNGATCGTDECTRLTMEVLVSGHATPGCDLRAPVLLTVNARPASSTVTGRLLEAPFDDCPRADRLGMSGLAIAGALRPLLPGFNLFATPVPWLGFRVACVETTTECVALGSTGTSVPPWVNQAQAAAGAVGQPVGISGVPTAGASLGSGSLAGTVPKARAANIGSRAPIDGERSDDNGLAWRVVARSWGYEADSDPFAADLSRRCWRSGYGVPALTNADAGALIRGRAGYQQPRGVSPATMNS